MTEWEVAWARRSRQGSGMLAVGRLAQALAALPAQLPAAAVHLEVAARHSLAAAALPALTAFWPHSSCYGLVDTGFLSVTLSPICLSNKWEYISKMS